MDGKEIFEKHAQKNMIEWNHLKFSITHRKLYKAIIESINEALNTPK